ncbi:hypothetical protein ETD86_13290 [Nonomuraea turkmeniaca]|uniref:Uncharacterized protein n=1 Tax=Nonomuraea turkmeniaca TaxID=103838 RepID=A0A5S4FNG6_9ACTN|nr:hypothetical protein [Nonomuraea turkmeniaca]TMR21994.1 hypothetical protein ETD86_13290 [Nonomuraea turkmeniaca]
MVQVYPPAVVPPVRALRARPLSSRRLPVALVVLLAIATLNANGVPLPEIGMFGAYIVVGVTLPGMLWWRALSGTPRSPVVDVAAGTALGYALEVLTYIPARWLDVPQAYLAGAGVTYLLFCAVPSLRRHWPARGESVRAPLGWSWAMAGLVGFAILYSAATFFRSHGLTWPGNGAPYVDMPYHLAMAGDVKHHMPAMFANVAGEALHDHWFVYADLAATSWATGLELQTLLFRLSPIPMIAVFTVLIAVVAHRLSGRWWAGVAAVIIMTLAAAPHPYGWTGAVVPSGGGGTLPWLSPTQTFGALLFVPLMLVLIDLVRHPGGRHGRWVLVAVLMLAEVGAKATFLPLTLAGATLVLTVHLIVHRKVHRAAAVLTGLCSVLVAFAQIVVFQGEDKGLRFSPLHIMRWHEAGLGPDAGLLLPGQDESPVLLLLVVTIFVVSWAAIWGGAAGLLHRRKWVRDPAVVLLAGVGVAGTGAACVFGHPGLSQGYFLMSAAPYLTILATAGLTATLPQKRPWLVVLPALAAGAAATWAVRSWVATARPQGGDVVAERMIPYALLVGVPAVVALVLVLAGRRGLTWCAVPVFALGCALYSGGVLRLSPLGSTAEPKQTTDPERPHVPDGGVTAARWLRQHTSPDALVAVNAHCRAPAGSCDNRHFWISAYAERRILVEGWGYINGANSRAALMGKPGMGAVPFEDPQRLADNDAAFRDPTTETVGRLRDTYGVRWLFADDRYPVRTAELGRVAALKFRAGHCWVYELTDPR